jgi:pimeloyl-ACP methyl ester carboxylesterase
MSRPGAVTPVPRLVKLPSGLSLSYVEQGSGQGPAIVLLHGLTDSWRSFAGVLPHLPASIRSIAVSQRGHGDSDKPDNGYRIGDFASDLAELFGCLGLASAVVVGHSSHGLVAQRFAIDYPELTDGIVLESSFATLRGNRNLRDLVATSIATLKDPIDRDFVRKFQEGTFLKSVPKSFIDMAVAETLKVPAHVWRAAFAGLLEEDHSSELGAIAAPTLLIWGDRDAIVMRDRQDQLLSGIGGSEIAIYEGVGHSPHWEEPERFAADLVRFLGNVRG